MLGSVSMLGLPIPPEPLLNGLLLISVGGTIVVYGLKIIYKACQNYQTRLHLSKLRKDKIKSNANLKDSFRKSTDQSILNSTETKAILKMNLNELISFLKKDPNNYKKVFDIYQQQALFHDQRLNCVIEFPKLDISDVDLTGPFAGLPISMKDSIIIKGHESVVGISKLLGKPKPSKDSIMTQALQKLGAIPFVITPVPQTMMTILSSNPIDGMIKNPQNLKFIPGGSSSGEGALIGAKGSLFGFGSDIGGSVRIPAAFCGIVGLKPTVGRLTLKGTTNPGLYTFIDATLGPLCQDVKSCTFIIKSIFNSEHLSILDPRVPFSPFNEKKYNKKKLKIGYFIHDDSYHVVPAMKRAVEDTVRKLKSRGHELVEWKPLKTGRDWWKLYLRGISPDGGKKLYSSIEYDIVDDAISNGIIYKEKNIFTSIFNALKYKLPDWIVDKDEKIFYEYSKGAKNKQGLFDLINEIESFRDDVINDWNDNGLDAVICPAGGFTALPIDFHFLYCPLLSYIFVWNLLNFPAGTVPATKVNRKDIEEMQTNPIYKSTKIMQNISLSQIDTEGLSVSVQCVALPWNEELCLNLMSEVETISSN